MARLRTNIYIDGFNLYYGCLRKTQYKWLDIEKACSQLLDTSKNEIHKIKYFTALVKARPNDPTQAVRQLTYLRALATNPKVEIIYGHFLSHKVMMPRADGAGMVQVIKTEEKKSDVNIALHMLTDAFKNDFDLAVLVSNDSDLSDLLRMVKVDLKKFVGVLNPQAHKASFQLREHALFLKQIRAGVLASSQLPTTLTDSTGTIKKPDAW